MTTARSADRIAEIRCAQSCRPQPRSTGAAMKKDIMLKK